MQIRLTPKGIALSVAVASGLIPSPSNDEEMSRFNEFWCRVEGEVIPEMLRKGAEVTIKPHIEGIEEAQAKAEKLVEAINSAKSLAGELAELCKSIKVTATVD